MYRQLLPPTNDDAERVYSLFEPEPHWRRLRRAIEAHRDDDRSAVLMSPNPRYLHASGYARHKMDWGPKQEPLENGEPCPECGYPFDTDEWATRHLGPGIECGEETWISTCPNCEQETAKVGT